MALRLIDAMSITPIYNGKSVLDKDAPLPPAPPHNTRNVIPVEDHDHCVTRIHHASLTSKSKKSAPVLTLGVQHRRHSAPAVLAFQQAFEKMKEKGSSIRNLNSSEKNSTAETTATPASSEAMDKLNAMFPTSPESLQKKKARRRLHQVELGGKNATFSPKGKRDTRQILADMLAHSGGSSSASPFGKSHASSGKLLLGHAAGMPRTPSGARLVTGSLRKVRSSGYIQF